MLSHIREELFIFFSRGSVSPALSPIAYRYLRKPVHAYWFRKRFFTHPLRWYKTKWSSWYWSVFVCSLSRSKILPKRKVLVEDNIRVWKLKVCFDFVSMGNWLKWLPFYRLPFAIFDGRIYIYHIYQLQNSQLNPIILQYIDWACRSGKKRFKYKKKKSALWNTASKICRANFTNDSQRAGKITTPKKAVSEF